MIKAIAFFALASLAAIDAASPNPADIREYFHLPYKLENGGFVSPIEKE